MKICRYAWVAVFGLCAWTTPGRADPDSPDNVVRYDRDGVPIADAKTKAQPRSAEEIAAIHKEEVRAAEQKDWLLRAYEKQLQKNAAGKSTDDQSSNLYFQLSTNKDLARLAGLPDLEDDDSPDYRTGEGQSGRSPAKLRGPSGAPTSMFASGSFVKPFISPMGAPGAAGLSNFYASLGGTSSPISGPATQPQPAPVSSSVEDPADIETPGMVAAEKNPNPATLDLSLDVLPDESIDHARAHQDNNELLALPLPDDADQLHRAQAAALSPQGIPGTPQAATTTPVVPKPIPVNDEDAPMQASKTPVITPVRAPIANPYDILNR